MTNSLRRGDADTPPPFPTHDGCRVTPLIEAAAMFPEFEELVLNAERSVWLAFRVFDPATKARSAKAEALGLADWSAIIGHVVGRGVEVRILLSDFEPILADHLHAGSWHSFRSLRKMAEDFNAAENKLLQLVVAQHEGELGWVWRQMLRIPLRRKVKALIGELIESGSADGGMLDRPGLWRYVKWEAGRAKTFRPASPPRMWPATHHQKFAIVDGAVTIVGGIDVDERRWDDKRHRQRADQTWHDISVRVEGPACGDVAAHFRALWNRELPRYREVVSEWTTGAARELTLDPLTDVPEAKAPPAIAGGAASVRVVRTLSRRSGSWFATGPRPCVRELREAHRELILDARRTLYIEAQFFRSVEAGKWVAEALRRAPELEIIILVANAPEEIAFEGQGENPAHKHGEYLQGKVLGRLLRQGHGRLGLFTLAKQQSVDASEKQFEDSRGTAYGAGVIHIHAKLLIADDARCLVSSANINGRSFNWDTELGCLWRERGDAIASFRRTLWSQLLGSDAGADTSLDDWRALAQANSMTKPEERTGFVVPYQLIRARRYARPAWFVPDDLV
ncbi:MAG TPA: hypothetical protein VEZ48_00055 [Sphingomonadaceae bacterium]|nr:hypothetical protein [Sphingomonadaceae bacterium]